MTHAERSQPFAPNPDLQERCMRYLLRCMGEDPQREGLVDTPRRWLKAMGEFLSGSGTDPAKVLGTAFTEPYSDTIWVRGIRFTSLCEHHLLPFTGTCVVGYVPSGKVVGLSKIPRLVQVYAKRLQLQEQLTRQVAETMLYATGCHGVGVAMRAHHSCMGCRGVQQPDAEMVTSTVLGAVRGDTAWREHMMHML